MEPMTCRNASPRTLVFLGLRPPSVSPQPLSAPPPRGGGSFRADSEPGAGGTPRGLAVLNSTLLGRCCAVPLLLLLAGCGRPATQQECEEIVVRVTELELKARGMAGSDAREVQDTKEALRKTTLRDCVGKRMSDQAMACVRSAKTAQQLVSQCF